MIIKYKSSQLRDQEGIFHPSTSVIDLRQLNCAIVCTRGVFVHVNRFHVLFIPSLLIYLQNLPGALFEHYTQLSIIQRKYKYPGEKIFGENMKHLLHNTSKDQRRGLWGYCRQRHDTKWYIYAADDLIQTHLYSHKHTSTHIITLNLKIRFIRKTQCKLIVTSVGMY